MRLTIGIDLAGGGADYSCVVAVADGHRVVFGERFERGWRFKSQHDRIEAIVKHLRTLGQTVVVLDATGLGRPQVETVRDRLNKLAVTSIGVTITSGINVGGTGQDLTVPKRDLVASAQVALEQGRLKFADDLALAPLLRDELASYRFKVTQSGNETFANGDSANDDAVMALCMATWYDTKHGGFQGGIVTRSMQLGRPQKATTGWFGQRGPLSARQ